MRRRTRDSVIEMLLPRGRHGIYWKATCILIMRIHILSRWTWVFFARRHVTGALRRTACCIWKSGTEGRLHLSLKVAFWSLKTQKDRSNPVRYEHADRKIFMIKLGCPRCMRSRLDCQCPQFFGSIAHSSYHIQPSLPFIRPAPRKTPLERPLHLHLALDTLSVSRSTYFNIPWSQSRRYTLRN